MTDFELLQRYAREGAEDAFRVVVERYANLVHSAALRQAGEAATAEDLSQAVFLLLARKAGGLGPEVVLSGWLVRAVRFVALNARRKEVKRLRVEAEATRLRDMGAENFPPEIDGLLDEALCALSESERGLITLRYFERKDFRVIGNILGTSDDTAQKRLARALVKLRNQLTKRGALISVAALSTSMLETSVSAAAPEAVMAGMQAAARGSEAVSERIRKLADGAEADIEDGATVGVAGRFAGVAALIMILALGLGHFRSTHRASGVSDTATNQKNSEHTVVQQTAPLPELDVRVHPLNLKVRDAVSGAPVAGVRLTIVWTSNYPEQRTNVAFTDVEGAAKIQVHTEPTQNWGTWIEVFKDGYVPKFVSWSQKQNDDRRAIPAEYTVSFSPATTIAATVMNEAGEPVPDALVTFNVRQLFPPGNSLERERLTMAPRYHAETTDSTGKWQCAHVPEQFAMISFNVSHPHYAPTEFGTAALGTTRNHGITYLARSVLREGTAIMQVAHGGIAAGIVTDEDGRPIAGAKVTYNQNWADPSASQLTDEQGRFRFANIPLEQTTGGFGDISFLGVQADGYVPFERKFKEPRPPAESQLQLSRGGLLRGQIVDERGEGIARAGIQICAHSNHKRFEWLIYTDDEGRFRAEHASTNTEAYIVEANGYKALPEFKWKADGAEHKVILQSAPGPITMGGSVTDATSGKSIENFEVWVAQTDMKYTGYAQPMSSSRPPGLRRIGSNGQFSFTNEDTLSSCILEIRAKGYSPEETRVPAPLTNDLVFAFQMKPATGIRGRVVLPDGTAVAGVTVLETTDANLGYMRLPGDFDLSFSVNFHTQTDGNGQFEMERKVRARSVIAYNAGYFGSIPVDELTEAATIVIKPWGKVSGSLKVGQSIAASETIDLYPANMLPHARTFSVFLETETDGDGKFSFSGVPPGNYYLAHRLNHHEGRPGPIPENLRTEIEVEADRTTEVVLGGSGRKVVGKLQAGNGRKVDLHADVQTMTTQVSARPELERKNYSSGAEQATAFEQWQQLDQAFWASPAGREARKKQRSYTLVFEDDGSFTINDVEPGTYELYVRISDIGKPIVGAPGGFRSPVATLRKTIVVPEQVGSSSEPGSFDLGVITVE